jgi:hypothetical protein
LLSHQNGRHPTRDVIELVRATAWPVTTLTIVLLLRSELQRLAAALAERIQSANSIIIGRRGLEIKGIAEPVVPTLQQRRLKFRRFINNVKVKLEMDRICDILKIEKSPSLKVERANIVDEVAGRVETSADMDAVSILLKNVTGEDF